MNRQEILIVKQDKKPQGPTLVTKPTSRECSDQLTPDRDSAAPRAFVKCRGRSTG